MRIAEVIAKGQADAQAQREAWQAEEAASRKRYEVQEAEFRAKVAPYLQPATVKAYANWMVKYIEAGGAPTHYYDYNMPVRDWRIALADFTMLPLYGSSAVRVIVRQGATFKGGELGHNTVYLPDGSLVGHWAPIYPDVTALLTER